MAVAFHSPLASSEEKTNGAKLSRLLIDGGTTVLRTAFDGYHPPANLAADLNANLPTLIPLLKKRVLRAAQWDKLFPPGGATPDSKTFDITLLFLLLTNICGLSPPLSGWHTKPSPSDTSLEANLTRIKFYRNELYGNVTSTSVDTLSYNALWLEISAVLVALGLNQTEVDRLKAERCREDNYLDVLLDWADSEQDIKSQLKDIRQELHKTYISTEKAVMAATASSPLASSVEKTNGAKLSRLLIDGGTTVLRNVFDSYHPPATLAADLNANYRTLNNLLRRRVLRAAQWDKLFPPGGATPDSKTFDITLLFLLLTNICGLSPPLSGWHTKPSPSDTSLEANLTRIKFYRNELYGNVTSTSVDTLSYNALWLEISAVLVALGLNQTEVDRLKAERCREDNYLDVLLDWADSEQDIKSQLKDIRQELHKTYISTEKAVMAATASSPLASSVEKTNGAKLSRLLIDGGTTVLRNVFDSYHPPATLAADLNANYRTLNNLLRRRVLRAAQWDKLFPPGGATPDSKTFDITLLFLLLTNICGLSPPLSGWHTKPSPSDTSLEANLTRIKFYRNELYGNVTSTSVDTPTFNALWEEISVALVALGLDQAEIVRLKAEGYGDLENRSALTDDHPTQHGNLHDVHEEALEVPQQELHQIHGKKEDVEKEVSTR